jgi:hypothetical protein
VSSNPLFHKRWATILRVLYAIALFTALSARVAFAKDAYFISRSFRYWNVPGRQTSVVFVITLLFGASVWFLARAIWVRDRKSKKINFMLAAITLIPALAIAALA